MSCGVIHRRGSEPSLLWLWYRPAAVAPIQPLAWEPPCAVGVVLKSGEKKLSSLNFFYVTVKIIESHLKMVKDMRRLKKYR